MAVVVEELCDFFENLIGRRPALTADNDGICFCFGLHKSTATVEVYTFNITTNRSVVEAGEIIITFCDEENEPLNFSQIIDSKGELLAEHFMGEATWGTVEVDKIEEELIVAVLYRQFQLRSSDMESDIGNVHSANLGIEFHTLVHEWLYLNNILSVILCGKTEELEKDIMLVRSQNVGYT